MADIYQEIWDADQAHAGLRAIRPGDPPHDGGYVHVDETATVETNHVLLPHVEIPEAKRASYDRVVRLFNNFTLDQKRPEDDTPEETQEVQQFLQEIHQTPPMEVARGYASGQMGRPIGPDEWRAIVERVWFERFSMGQNKDLSGFEHIIVGERKDGTVGGYHFWYKYYLDENFRAPSGETKDLIKFRAWKNGTEQTPDSVTLSYLWNAYDYTTNTYREISKATGGFWVGPSVEGLMAMGTVRFLPEVAAPRQAVINGHRYKLTVHTPENNKRNLRSFYPEYVGPAQPAPMAAELTAAAGGAKRAASWMDAGRDAAPGASVIARSGLYFVDPDTRELTRVR